VGLRSPVIVSNAGLMSVGGGPAGLVAAVALARRGISTTTSARQAFGAGCATGSGTRFLRLPKNLATSDVVYCDVDKDGYPDCWRAARDSIRVGGLWLCDNTIWSGYVASGTDKEGEVGVTAVIRERNRLVAETARLDLIRSRVSSLGCQAGD